MDLEFNPSVGGAKTKNVSLDGFEPPNLCRLEGWSHSRTTGVRCGNIQYEHKIQKNPPPPPQPSIFGRTDAKVMDKNNILLFFLDARFCRSAIVSEPFLVPCRTESICLHETFATRLVSYAFTSATTVCVELWYYDLSVKAIDTSGIYPQRMLHQLSLLLATNQNATGHGHTAIIIIPTRSIILQRCRRSLIPFTCTLFIYIFIHHYNFPVQL